MIWTAVFTVSIAQGIFLLVLLLRRSAGNRLATRLLTAVILVMILTNLDFVLVSSGLYRSVPELFGISFGMMFLLGPLFYFYARSITDRQFSWKARQCLHFVPYLVELLMNLSFMSLSPSVKVAFIEAFAGGNLKVRGVDLAIFAVQDVHFSVYLALVYRRTASIPRSYGNISYIISITERVRWLRSLWYALSSFLLTVVLLLLYLAVAGTFDPVSNYSYTVIASAIIYLLAYKLVLSPELFTPDFERKYKSYRQFETDTHESIVKRLNALMEEQERFIDPDLSLASIADELQLPVYQVSKIINEHFGKSFSDFVGEYRVKAYIARINDPRYSAFSLYGIALEVGFNSKSSFNSIFKKVTGKTPSEYKRDSRRN
jgi:AraC-like DNA-binding protein